MNARFWALAAVTALLFGFNVARFWFIGDDAFISFRYAQNLVQGHGLVWEPSEEPVEGYTNFLWVLLMAAGMQLDLPPEALSLTLGVASGAGVLAMLVWFGRRNGAWAWAVPLLLASTRTFAAWSTGGLETMWFTLLILSGLLTYLNGRETGGSLIGSAILLGLAVLTRPDAALFVAVAGAGIGLDLLAGRRRMREGMVWGLVLAAMVVPHLLWRHAYYDDWVPNTFHAKVGGHGVEHGLRYLWLFQLDYWALAWAWLAGVAIWRGSDRHRACFFLAVIAAQIAYILAVGGDRFEFRFLVPVLPFLFWLVADGLRSFDRRIAVCGIAALAAFLLWRSPEVQDKHLRAGVAKLETIHQTARVRSEQGRRVRHLVETGILIDDLRICVGAAGALPYYSGVYSLDYFGLNDKVIAKSDADTDAIVAHQRQASAEYIVQKQIDVVAFGHRLLADNPTEALRRLRKIGDVLRKRKVERAFRAVCRRAGPWFMVYATPQSEREQEERLGLPDCNLN